MIAPDPSAWADQYNEEAMARELDAIYEHGVLRPLEPLSLPEHQRVRLTIEAEPRPLNGTAPEPVNHRLAEMRWFAEKSGPYGGEWVAIEGSNLVAHGARLAEVQAAAKAAGANDPLFARVPREDLPDGGW